MCARAEQKSEAIQLVADNALASFLHIQVWKCVGERGRGPESECKWGRLGSARSPPCLPTVLDNGRRLLVKMWTASHSSPKLDILTSWS
eukprot:158741-Chlamydomonas_euryale.AAC.1